MEHKKRNKTLQKSKKPTNKEDGGMSGETLQKRLDFYKSRMEAEKNGDDSAPTEKKTEQPPQNAFSKRLQFYKDKMEAEQKASSTPASKASDDGKADVGETKKLETKLGVDSQLLTGKTNPEEKDGKQTETITAKTDKEGKEKSDEKPTNDTQQSDKTTIEVAPIQSKIENPDKIGANIKSGAQSTPDGDKDTKKEGGDAGAGAGGGRLINMVHKQFDGLDTKLSAKVDSQKTLVKDSLRKATAPGMAKNKKAIEKTKKEEKRKTPTVVKLKEVTDSEEIPQKAADTEKAQENVKGLSKKEVKKADKGPIKQTQEGLNAALKDKSPKNPEDFEDKDLMKNLNDAIDQGVDELFDTVEAKTKEVGGEFKEIDNPGLGEAPRTAKQLPDLEKAKNTDLISVEDLQKKVPDEQFKPIINDAQQGSIDTLKKEGIGDGEAISYEDFKQAKSEDLRRGITAHESIQEEATKAPGEIRKTEKEKHDALGKAVREREQTKRSQMRASRDEQLRSSRGNQTRAKSDYEVQRAAITAKMDEVFNTARTAVTEKLAALDTQVKLKFSGAKKKAMDAFTKNVETRLDQFHDARYRHGGQSVLGYLYNVGRSWFEDTSDLPQVLAIFDDERQTFINAIDAAITEIVSYVESEVAACKKIIEDADKQLETIANAQGSAFKKIASEAYTRIRKKLDKLDSDVDKKAAELKKYLEGQRKKAIADVDKKIAEIKEKLKGLLNRVGKFLLDAAYKFFKWVLSSQGFSTEQIDQIINQGREVLTKIVTDPMGFFKNMAAAVGQGFGSFVGNIGTHLKNGLFSWLTGAMSGAGLNLPQKWDMKGIFSVVLQVMGISWANIRVKIAKEVGEEALTKAEQATEGGLELFQQIKEKGFVDAMWDMLSEKAGMIQQMVMDEIKNWLIVTVIKKAITDLLLMLNPAGAIAKAIIAIYKFAMWLINNWQRIVDIIKNIVTSIGKIALGQIGEASKFIETVLANFVPILIDFLARMLNLGNVSERIKKIIMRLRKPIDEVIAKIIRFIKGKLKGLGKGKKGKKETKDQTKKDMKKDKDGVTAADKRKHQKIGKEIEAELKKRPQKKPKSFEKFYESKTKKARNLEKKHQKRLKKGVRLKISFNNLSKDKQDGDVDFKIKIFTNTTEVRGEAKFDNSDLQLPGKVSVHDLVQYHSNAKDKQLKILRVEKSSSTDVGSQVVFEILSDGNDTGKNKKVKLAQFIDDHTKARFKVIYPQQTTDRKNKLQVLIQKIDKISMNVLIGNTHIGKDMKVRYKELKDKYDKIKLPLLKIIKSKPEKISDEDFEELKDIHKKVLVLAGVLEEKMNAMKENPDEAEVIKNSNCVFGNYSILYKNAQGEEKSLNDKFVSLSARATTNDEMKEAYREKRNVLLMDDAQGGMSRIFIQVRPTSGVDATQDAERKVLSYLYNQLIPDLTDQHTQNIINLSGTDFKDLHKSVPGLEISGEINIYTEMSPCSACDNSISKFRGILGNNVRVNVRHGVIFRDKKSI